LVAPNYAFQKRQKELAKQAKNEEKRRRKAAANEQPAEGADAVDGATPPVTSDDKVTPT
jgi:hypothetical protein